MIHSPHPLPAAPQKTPPIHPDPIEEVQILEVEQWHPDEKSPTNAVQCPSCHGYGCVHVYVNSTCDTLGYIIEGQE